jgi:probable addiction module antidote protein
MKTKVSEFGFSEYLSDEESIAEYLTAIIEENDIKLLLSAIGDTAKAQGMNRIFSRRQPTRRGPGTSQN